MIRILIGGVAGAVAVYIWGMLAWMVLGLHDDAVRNLPQPDGVVEQLQSHDLTSGVYYYPGMPEHSGEADEQQLKQAQEAWTKQHEEGPIFAVIYRPEGATPMGPNVMLGGLVIDWLAAMLASVLLWMAAPKLQRYFDRVAFVTILGVFAGLVSHAAYWNWMWFPANHTISMMVDVAAAWFIAGLVMAVVVRSPAQS